MTASVALGAYEPSDWDEAGERVCGAVAVLLRALGYANVFTAPPSALVCCEPIVLTCGAFSREARLAEGSERGEQA